MSGSTGFQTRQLSYHRTNCDALVVARVRFVTRLMYCMLLADILLYLWNDLPAVLISKSCCQKMAADGSARRKI